ncbi:hypothetical protein ACLQ2R_00710 [Streptosporangium sp. DT93]|uniref:hypothetical protein n=1 Tax=Streptosporangium sp. DT93 TaxID=3393428 RepID=UPI003CF31535
MLEQIAEGGLPPIILVDFAVFSVTDTMTDLMSGVPGPGRSVYRIDAVQDLEAYGDTTIARLADVYAREVGELPVRPAGVLGYCSAATLALELADRLGEGGDAPHVVLVEPTWLTPGMIGQELGALRATLGAAAEPPAGLSLTTALDTLTGDLERKLAGEDMSEAEREMCVTMMTRRYRAWFGFLFATAATPAPTPVTPVSLVVGAGSDRGPAPGWTADRCSTDRVDVPADGFLRSAEVRLRIFDLIDRRYGHVHR